MRLVLLVALVGCSKQRDRAAEEPGAVERAAERGGFEIVQIDTPPGMSDLTLDDRGVMWSIAERNREVLELELGKPPIRHPLDGVPLGIDTEGLAWLSDGHFAIGAEGAAEPTAAIMFGELRMGHLVITRTRKLINADLGIELTINHGIEAVCGRGDELLAASETVGRLPDGSRYAPLVRLHGDELTITKVKLTTDSGKLSALDCSFDGDGTAEVIAIERHFGVSRILRFTVKRDDAEVTPTVELDLHPILQDALNLEGIVRLRDGRWVLINDNQHSKGANGGTQLLVFPKR
jgi:hypothetical protein